MKVEPDCDLSVIIPFTDDEEKVGSLSRRVAAHLNVLEARFEILAVDEGSGDNSLALLSLLRDELPWLRVLAASSGRGFAAGAREARGRIVWLWDAASAAAPLAPFFWAHGRVSGGAGDVVIVPGRYAVCHRTAAWRVLDRARGRGRDYERQLAKYALRANLRVDTPPSPVPAPARPRLRWIRALSPAALLRQRA
jgi:hypothetical protein